MYADKVAYCLHSLAAAAETVQQLINIPVFTAATFAVVAHAG